MQRSWPFQVLVCEIVRGRCRFCNVDFSREEAPNTRNLFENHKRHFDSVTVVGRVASPVEYRGLELSLALVMFSPRGQSDDFLRVPCLIFRLCCLRCDVEVFPGSETEILTFRNRHEFHAQAIRLYAMVQPMVGHAVKRKLEICGYSEPCNSVAVNETVSNLDQLKNLRRTLTCTLLALKCTSCRVRQRFHSDAHVSEFMESHERHLSHVYLKGTIEDPPEYGGIDFNFLASPFEWRSLQRDLQIECMAYEMCHGIGHTCFASLWRWSDIRQCLEKYATERHGVRVRSLVKGKWGRLFELEFALCLSPATRPLLDFEQQWLSAESG